MFSKIRSRSSSRGHEDYKTLEQNSDLTNKMEKLELDNLEQDLVKTENKDHAELQPQDLSDLFDNINLDPHTKQCMKSMSKDPIGRHIQLILADLAKLLARKGIRSTTDIESLSRDFHQKNLQEGLKINSIHEAIKDIKAGEATTENIYELKIEPPQYFSNLPQLSGEKLMDAIRLFPGFDSKRRSFSGVRDPTATTVCEFLLAMNNAQAKCNLSKPEFLEMLLSGTTAVAHSRLLTWLQLNHTVRQIYALLLSMYDDSIPPHVAESRLKHIKGSTQDTSCKLENEIMELATAACMSLPPGESRQLIMNYWATSSFIDSLPETSRAFVSQEFRKQAGKLGKLPSFVQLTSLINAHRPDIDRDLKRNGTPHEWRNRNSWRENY